MHIYFVRHGQTEGNIARRHQANTTRLTELGKEQALRAAHAVKLVNPDFFISSSMVRAVETSSIIAQVCDLIPSTGQVFAELERPVGMYGYHHNDPRSLWFYIRWYFGLVDTKKLGGESYADFRQRIGEAQEVLMKYPPDAKLVVVSHSVFINFFLAHMCSKRPLSPWRALWYFIHVFRIKNGSITKVTYNPEMKHGCAWQLEKVT